jgi:hypothetical protein
MKGERFWIRQKEADLIKREIELETQRKKKVDFEADQLRQLKLENARMKGELSEMRMPEVTGANLSLASVLPQSSQPPIFQQSSTAQANFKLPRVPMPGTQNPSRGNLSGGFMYRHNGICSATKLSTPNLLTIFNSSSEL